MTADALPETGLVGQSAAEVIAEAIRERIRSRALVAGDCLPSQQALAAQFLASRHDVRTAIASLVREGLVSSEQGRGMFVRGLVVDYRIKSRTRWTEMVQGTDRLIAIRILKLEEKRGDAGLWWQLATKRGERIVEFTLLRTLDERPLCIAHHHLPALRFPGLAEQMAGLTSVTDLYQKYGVADYLRADTTVTSRSPTREEASLLQIRRSQPVIVLEGRNIEKDGRPLEISRSIWPADRITVRI